MSINNPLGALVEERLGAVHAATAEGDVNSAVLNLLDAFAAIGRSAAQIAWTLRHEMPDRDDLMQGDEDDLVFQMLQTPLSAIYPELASQAEAVMREAFQDELFRLEHPEGWAVINREMSTSGEARQ